MFGNATHSKSAKRKREEEKLSNLFQREELLDRIRTVDTFLQEQQDQSRFGLKLNGHKVDINRDDLVRQINGFLRVIRDRIRRSTSYRFEAFYVVDVMLPLVQKTSIVFRVLCLHTMCSPARHSIAAASGKQACCSATVSDAGNHSLLAYFCALAT
jgi:hypothetical protein